MSDVCLFFKRLALKGTSRKRKVDKKIKGHSCEDVFPEVWTARIFVALVSPEVVYHMPQLYGMKYTVYGGIIAERF